MLVKDCMTRHPIMISPKTPASEAEKIMAENQIRHLPVVGDGKQLLGLITRQRLAMKPDELASLSVWEISRHVASLTAQKIMLKTSDVYTISANKTVERAAKVMTDNKVGGLPVIEDGVVAGIITETDLLKAFQIMLGLPAEGVRVTIRIPEGGAIFKRIVNAISDQGWPIMGLGNVPARKLPGYWDCVFKIAGTHTEDVEKVLADIQDIAIVDIRTVV